jgi:hypothetical protein
VQVCAKVLVGEVVLDLGRSVRPAPRGLLDSRTPSGCERFRSTQHSVTAGLTYLTPNIRSMIVLASFLDLFFERL